MALFITSSFSLHNILIDGLDLFRLTELDGSHVKHTQLKFRRSRYHKAQHSL